MKENIDSKAASLELPKVDWLDRESNPEKFFKDLSYALSEFGFMVLTNAPGLSDEFQKRAFREVRGFFDSPMELKKTASPISSRSLENRQLMKTMALT